MPGVGVAVSPFVGSPRAGAVWTPTSLSNCVLWLQADTGITLNGADVATWEDQSGSSNDHAQATPANQPLYVAGPPALVRFTAAAAEHLEAAVIAGIDDGYTLGVAMRLRATGAIQTVYGNGNPGTIGLWFGERSGRAQDHQLVARITWGAVTTSAERWIFRHDGVGGSADFMLDGVNQAPQALGNNVPPSIGASCIGTRGGGTSFPADVDVYGIVGYSDRKSDAEIALLDTYLQGLM